MVDALHPRRVVRGTAQQKSRRAPAWSFGADCEVTRYLSRMLLHSPLRCIIRQDVGAANEFSFHISCEWSAIRVFLDALGGFSGSSSTFTVNISSTPQSRSMPTAFGRKFRTAGSRANPSCRAPRVLCYLISNRVFHAHDDLNNNCVNSERYCKRREGGRQS